MQLTIICDGGSRGNPGPSASAFVVYQGDQAIFQAGFYWGEGTNNQAEYRAVIMALEWLIHHHNSKNLKVEVIMDSELVINQLAGRYKIKSTKLRPLYQHATRLIGTFRGRLSFSHSLRSGTTSADALVNQILDLAQRA